MIIFIIGPSGAGKSFLLDKISADLKGTTLIDLDAKENEITKTLKQDELRGWDGRWERGMAILSEIENKKENDDKRILVDVGAGSLQMEAAFKYFSHRLPNIILVTAEKDILCKRGSRAMDDLLKNEFTDQHKNLHGLIMRVVDNSSDDPIEAQKKLVVHIDEIFQQH